MSIVDEFKLLSNMPLFECLEATELKRLIMVSERYELASGEYLFHQGETSDMVFVTIQGTFSVLVNTSNGELELNTIQGIDLIGEIGAISGDLRAASIRAKSAGEVIGIESKLFLSTITNDPRTALKIMQLLTTRFKQLALKSISLNQTNEN